MKPLKQQPASHAEPPNTHAPSSSSKARTGGSSGERQAALRDGPSIPQEASGRAHASQPSQGAGNPRKVAILVDLLQAESREQLDMKLAQLSSEVDGEVIGVLEERLQAARLCKQLGTPAMQQVEQLYCLLKRAHQRRGASPAMRLLDDVLELLGDGSDPAPSGEPVRPARARGATGGDVQLVQAYEQRRFKARLLMRDAFAKHDSSLQDAAAVPSTARSEQHAKQPGAEPGSGAAAATGDVVQGASPTSAAPGGNVEAVPVDGFLQAVAQVLEAAEAQQQQLKKLTGRRPARDVIQPTVDEQLLQAAGTLEQCTLSVAQLEDVLTIARSLRACPKG